jgi:hypothetical protein
MKQVLYVSAVSLALIFGLSGCSNSNDPGQSGAAAAPPPPPPLFGPPPGDNVQSPGNYTPAPGRGPYRGN